MLTIYPACFYKDGDGYSVIFPDLNDLATCGETLDEAIEMAVDCLAGHVYFSTMEDDDLPSPSSINEVDPKAVAQKLDFDSNEYFVNMVAVDVNEYAKLHFEKPVKKTLTIPAWLNDTAQSKGINFSAVLQEALKERMGISN